MNIIKFKDQVRPGDPNFNTYLKGKYAYWIRMRYVVPFEAITSKEYVEFEQDITLLTNWREQCLPGPKYLYWDLYGKHSNLEAWVDAEKTESANNIMPFSRHNMCTTDADLTEDGVKKFRTWLADALLEFDRNPEGAQKCQFYTEEFTDVLEYYAAGMYNVTVKRLSNIKPAFTLTPTGVSNCGCGSGTDISGLYGQDGAICDPLAVYRRSVYVSMCEKFADIDFWQDFPSVFLYEFKQYIDNIIALNLPLTKSNYTSVYVDCTCQTNPEQGLNMDILKRLSNSLAYMAEGEVLGNKNYISKAFQDWAADLYESMEWA